MVPFSIKHVKTLHKRQSYSSTPKVNMRSALICLLVVASALGQQQQPAAPTAVAAQRSVYPEAVTPTASTTPESAAPSPADTSGPIQRVESEAANGAGALQRASRVRIQETTNNIDEHIEIPIPTPYPVITERKIPITVTRPYAFNVPRPVTLPVSQLNDVQGPRAAPFSLSRPSQATEPYALSQQYVFPQQYDLPKQYTLPQSYAIPQFQQTLQHCNLPQQYSVAAPQSQYCQAPLQSYSNAAPQQSARFSFSAAPVLTTRVAAPIQTSSQFSALQSPLVSLPVQILRYPSAPQGPQIFYNGAPPTTLFSQTAPATYSAPRTVFTAEQTFYTTPRPALAPQPLVYTTPRPVFAPQPLVYTTPRPALAPQPLVYTTPRSVFAPQLVDYTTPKPDLSPQPIVHSTPRPVLAAQPVFSLPQPILFKPRIQLPLAPASVAPLTPTPTSTPLRFTSLPLAQSRYDGPSHAYLPPGPKINQ